MSALVAELEPRVITPDAEKQQQLGIAEETMLIPVGVGRALTVSPTLEGGWSIKEFDTSQGTLNSVWDETGALTDELAIEVVLSRSIRTLQSQIESGAAPQFAETLALLEARRKQLIDFGLGSFEFEAVEPEVAKKRRR